MTAAYSVKVLLSTGDFDEESSVTLDEAIKGWEEVLEKDDEVTSYLVTYRDGLVLDHEAIEVSLIGEVDCEKEREKADEMRENCHDFFNN